MKITKRAVSTDLHRPTVMTWRLSLAPGSPCRLMRDGVLSRKVYTFVRYEMVGKFAVPAAIVDNGSRELFTPIGLRSVVPAGRTAEPRPRCPSVWWK